MRFLVVLAIIVGLIWYGVNTLRGGGPRELIGSGMEKLAGATAKTINPKIGNPPQKAAAGVEVQSLPVDPGYSPRPALGLSLNGDEKKAMQLVRFKHREPPTAESVTIAAALACTLTVDTVGRSVVIVGPLEGVDICKRYLESVDVPLGSCAVRSWAVYVDKSVQQGFDLIAAIGAVSSVDFRAGISGGAMTLDLGGDDVALALSAICDGSSVEVVQRPHVQLSHGVTSKIESIQEVPVPSTAVSQGIAQTSIEYRKVGLQLEVVPHFLAGNRLRIAVGQTNGLIGRTVDISGNQVPIIESQSVQTSVEMSIGQTVILGGVTTLRQRHVKGFLRNSTETTEGTLYVIISTYFDHPRAVPVGAVTDPLSIDSVPLLPDFSAGVDACEILLPSIDWQEQEAEFVKSRSSK